MTETIKITNLYTRLGATCAFNCLNQLRATRNLYSHGKFLRKADNKYAGT